MSIRNKTNRNKGFDTALVDEELQRISSTSSRPSIDVNPLDDEGYGSADFDGESDEDYQDEADGLDDDIDQDYDEGQSHPEFGEYMDELRRVNNFKPRSARNLTEAERKRRARSQFMRQARGKQNDPELKLYLSKANQSFVDQQLELAAGYYKKVLEIDPKNPSAYKGLATIAEQLKDHEERCKNLYLAAQNSPWESHLWVEVAELSIDLGNIERAIKAYGKAIHLRTEDRAALLFKRAMLYKEIKQYGRALDGLRRLRELEPEDPGHIKELASIYVADKRETDAINLYMDILDKNLHPKPGVHRIIPPFEWTELNILLELYIGKRQWIPALKVTKLAARYIQDRTDETWWDEDKDCLDAEFDSTRRIQYLETVSQVPAASFSKEFELPIDIRFKLGQIRLELGKKEEAMIHFNLLMDEDDIPDLFFEAGKCLELHGYFQEALIFLPKAVTEDGTADLEVTTHLANCYLATGDYETAKQAYFAILDHSPEDINIKISLVEALYYLGEYEEAQEMLREISKQRKSLPNAFGEDVNDELMLLAGKTNKNMTEEEKFEIEENSKRRILDTYRRMSKLEADVLNGSPIAISTWMQLASRLIGIFTSVPSFFPRDKNRTFKGIVSYRRKKPMEVDERIVRVYDLYDGMSSNFDDGKSRSFLTSVSEFRGLSYDQWFMIFVQYAILLGTVSHDLEYAVQTVDIAMDVSVFVQDKSKESILRLIRLTLGIHSGEYCDVVMPYVRFFLASNQFSPFIYNLFLSCFASGADAYDAFSNYNHQKFFLRQLKAFDSIVNDKKITGMATITAETKGVTVGKEHCELLYIYANLLGGTKNYISPIVYLNRAYSYYSQDPMICLTLGIAHVHRSMQRLSTNRHIQLLQGISYILEYRELRLRDATSYEKQETEYNVARVFHMIGLTSEAVTHYERVLSYYDELEDKDFDLSVDAAYNLSLVYNSNGNSQLANDITEKFLTI